MKAQTTKATLSPGIEVAINSFLENSDDVQGIVDHLTFIFNAFLTTDDFTHLNRIDKSLYSEDFHHVLNLLQTLKKDFDKSGYEITANGIQQRKGVAA